MRARSAWWAMEKIDAGGQRAGLLEIRGSRKAGFVFLFTTPFEAKQLWGRVFSLLP